MLLSLLLLLPPWLQLFSMWYSTVIVLIISRFGVLAGLRFVVLSYHVPLYLPLSLPYCVKLLVLIAIATATIPLYSVARAV